MSTNFTDRWERDRWQLVAEAAALEFERLSAGTGQQGRGHEAAPPGQDGRPDPDSPDDTRTGVRPPSGKLGAAESHMSSEELAELPPGDLDGIAALVAEVTEATSSPQALRRWERKAARERAQEQAVLTALEQAQERRS